MRAKLAEKRAAQSKVDAEEARANEKVRRHIWGLIDRSTLSLCDLTSHLISNVLQIRRKAGQDQTLAVEEMKKKEAIKDQQRKAAEKKAEVSDARETSLANRDLLMPLLLHC